MAVRLSKGSTGSRVKMGASVLAAARTLDTRLVKERLGRFEEAHRNYAGAQKKVDAAEAQFTAAMARVEEHRAVQATAVDALARALVAEGHPLRGNPFAAFGAPTPSALMRLPFEEGTAATHKLVAAVLRDKNASTTVAAAAQQADKAASAVEEALVPIAKLEDSVRGTRRMRDAMGPPWDTALAALRRGTRAAADEGAPELHATLFPAVSRTSKTKAPGETAGDGAPPPEGAPKAA